MIVRYLSLALLAGASLMIASPGMARETSLSRKEIRAMPILQRPSRPGHFYGNTVRRNHSTGAVQSVRPSPAQSNTLVPENNPGLRY
jgi:hypothetical protein